MERRSVPSRVGGRLATDYRMDLAGSPGVFGKERKDIRSAGGQDASVIASRNLDVLMRHLQFQY